MKNRIICIILTILLISCNKYSREDFSFSRMDNNSSKLKLDGYYYNQINEQQYVVFFIFKNGVFFDGSIREIEDSQKIDDAISTYDFSQQYNLPYYWGIYQINNDEIIIEEWSSGDGGKYPLVTHMGRIVNDTLVDFGNDFFGRMKFRQFSPKPDSTTRFIE